MKDEKDKNHKAKNICSADVTADHAGIYANSDDSKYSEASAADSINVTLSKSSKEYTYGGTGLAYHYTTTYKGKTRQAYCLQPNEMPPDTGSRKASAMPDSSKVSKTMYYCYGYPGQKKLAKWLSNNGYDSHASGIDFYLLCHVLLSYQYDSSTAFHGLVRRSMPTQRSASRIRT
jgi:hypothetical protein